MYVLPSYSPFTPIPVILSKPVISAASTPRPCTTAIANGCSECFSSPHNIGFSSSLSSVHTQSVATGVPSVIVPVLSSTTVSTLRAISRLSASLINIPISAPLPIPTIMAVGVASPKAHGQATTNTVTAARKP